MDSHVGTKEKQWSHWFSQVLERNLNCKKKRKEEKAGHHYCCLPAYASTAYVVPRSYKLLYGFHTIEACEGFNCQT